MESQRYMQIETDSGHISYGYVYAEILPLTENRKLEKYSADIPENPIPAVIHASETEKGCGCGRIIIQDH